MYRIGKNKKIYKVKSRGKSKRKTFKSKTSAKRYLKRK